MEGRQGASGFGEGVGKVIEDKDGSQKSAQGNRGAAGALAERLCREVGWLFRMR